MPCRLALEPNLALEPYLEQEVLEERFWHRSLPCLTRDMLGHRSPLHSFHCSSHNPANHVCSGHGYDQHVGAGGHVGSGGHDVRCRNGGLNSNPHSQSLDCHFQYKCRFHCDEDCPGQGIEKDSDCNEYDRDHDHARALHSHRCLRERDLRGSVSTWFDWNGRGQNTHVLSDCG